MCVVALALDCHPRWHFILVANRDEYHARPSAPLARWGDAPHIMAGRDLQAGGSWLGVSEQGRLAVVTNIRTAEAANPQKLSRGALVRQWLADAALPDAVQMADYNPFNLLSWQGHSGVLLSNYPEPFDQPLAPGIHGLSNGHPGEPWPRRTAAETALANWLAAGEAEEALFDLLRDEWLRDDMGAPIFIKAPLYGTRCSTIVLVDRDGIGRIAERSFYPDGSVAGDAMLHFSWADASL